MFYEKVPISIQFNLKSKQFYCKFQEWIGNFSVNYLFLMIMSFNFSAYNGLKPYLVVGEPELIKDIMVKDFHNFTDRQKSRIIHPILRQHLVNAEGEQWKRVRAIVSPTFSSGKMKAMYPSIKRCLNEFLESLDVIASEGRDLNVKQEFNNYTMDVIASCAFGTNTNVHKDSNNLFMKNALQVFNPKLYRTIAQAILPTRVLMVLNMYSTIDEKVNNFFFDLTRQMIQQRKASKKKYNDFLELMISAQKTIYKNNESEDTTEAHHNLGQEEVDSQRKAYGNVKDKYLTDDEMLAQAWIFFNAGFETTASTLTFATYELALNPDIQQRLYEEVIGAIDSNGDIDYDLLSRLPYLDAVISETLRYHSPVVRTGRQANEDYKLGNTGLTVKKGQVIEIPIHAIQHAPEFWHNPNQFSPERFLPENRHKIVSYTYLPFGGGPRNCIGMRFALMEAKVGLAQVIRRFRLYRCAHTDVPLDYKTHLILQSPNRVIVGIERRD